MIIVFIEISGSSPQIGKAHKKSHQIESDGKIMGIQSLVGSEFRGVCPWGLLIGSFSGVLQWGLLVGSAIAGPLFYIKKTEEMTSLPDFPIMMFLHYTS